MSPNNRDQAVALALERAQRDFQAIPVAELPPRLQDLDLPVPDTSGNSLGLTFMNQDLTLSLHDLGFAPPVDPVRRILILRYICAPLPLPDEGASLGYRELPGASFYVGPFRSRSVDPLAGAVGANLHALSCAAASYGGRPLKLGDAGWRFPVLGKVWMDLAWYEPDEEFPGSCELFFAPCVARVYSADEAAILGSLLCLGLVRGLRPE